MKRMNRSQVIRSLVESYEGEITEEMTTERKKKSSKRRENQVNRAIRRGEIHEKRERSSSSDEYDD